MNKAQSSILCITKREGKKMNVTYSSFPLDTFKRPKRNPINISRSNHKTSQTLQTLHGKQPPWYSQPRRNESYFPFSRLKGFEKGNRKITPLMVCLPEGKAPFQSLVLTTRNSRPCVHSKVITLWLWIPTESEWPWGPLMKGAK